MREKTIFISNKSIFLINAAKSFFSAWALMKASRMEPGNILTGVFFLLSFFFYRHIHERLDKLPFMKAAAVPRTCGIISLFFTLFYMAVDYPSYISQLTNPFFRAIIITAVFIGFFILFHELLLLLYSYAGNQAHLSRLLSGNDCCVPSYFRKVPGLFQLLQHLLPVYQKYTGLCSFLLCLLCWLPYFLYQYPGIMTPDSINQFEQVLGLIPYSNHHPWVHTLLIKLLYSIGRLFTSDMVTALSFYTFFQMCIMALAVSYFIQTLRQLHIRNLICFFVTLFYALIPYHAVFAVTLWKDILFAAALLFFSCSLLRLKQEIRLFSVAVFTLSGIMICLFRSNGWYGFLLCLPFFIWYFIKKAKPLLPALTVIVLVAVIVKYPVMNAFCVVQPDFIESLSIPTQQVAAVICNDRELSLEQTKLIEQVIDTTYIKDLYNPTYADNIKELVRAGNQEYLIAHKQDYFRLWLTLGFTYPADYLKAYINQTYGYWYPDCFYPVAEAEGISGTSLGVSHTPLIGGPLVLKTKEIAIKMGNMVPVYSLLWSMGVAFWIFIFCIGNAFIRKEPSKLILYLPSMALYLTVMIATPVATEFRYVYFMVFALPFYLLSALIPNTCKEMERLKKD